MLQTSTRKPSPATQVAASTEAKPQKSLVWAYRLLWLTFIIFFASTGAGKLWDRVWHATHIFDTFWSPPHFFVFVMTVMTSSLVAIIALNSRLRVWFGPTIRLPLLPFEIPGSLALLGGGLVALCITIVMDNFWHSAFGLDETQWSMPHDMLGWSWFTIILGFLAARLAFRKYRPLNWLTNMVIALLVLEYMCPPILGPFYLNYAPHLLHAFMNLPVVRAEPTAQHMYRIYLHFGLTRLTSPLFIPIVAGFAGAALAFLRAFDFRARIFLLAPLAWSLVLMGRDLYTIYALHYSGVKKIMDVLPVALHEPSLWVPIPLFIAALVVYTLQRGSFFGIRPYAIAGVIFGFCTFCIWHTASWEIVLALPAACTMVIGSWVGRWIYTLVDRPTFETFMRLLLTNCAQIPAALGVVDLFLRRLTP